MQTVPSVGCNAEVVTSHPNVTISEASFIHIETSTPKKTTQFESSRSLKPANRRSSIDRDNRQWVDTQSVGRICLDHEYHRYPTARDSSQRMDSQNERSGLLNPIHRRSLSEIRTVGIEVERQRADMQPDRNTVFIPGYPPKLESSRCIDISYRYPPTETQNAPGTRRQRIDTHPESHGLFNFKYRHRSAGSRSNDIEDSHHSDMQLERQGVEIDSGKKKCNRSIISQVKLKYTTANLGLKLRTKFNIFFFH